MVISSLAILASAFVSPASAQSPARPVSYIMEFPERLCIETRGAVQDGAFIVLGDCKHPGAVLIPDAENNRIRFAARQQLCLGFDDIGRGLAVPCSAVEQRYRYDELSQAIRFAVIEGVVPDCLSVRGAPRIGSRVVMAACSNALNQRFSVEAPFVTSPEPPPIMTPPPLRPRQ